MPVFIGAVKKKGAYRIEVSSIAPVIEFVEGETPDDFDYFSTFAKAKKGLIRRLQLSFDDYKYAILYVKRLTEPNVY